MTEVIQSGGRMRLAARLLLFLFLRHMSEKCFWLISTRTCAVSHATIAFTHSLLHSCARAIIFCNACVDNSKKVLLNFFREMKNAKVKSFELLSKRHV